MDANKKYQIFISSTYTDLISARAKVMETILSMYQFPIGMEMFSAGNNDQWTTIKKTIEMSDYYVLIVGHRYGSITPEGISYTEKEFDFAQKIGVPILAFIMNRDIATKPSQRETDSNLQNKLQQFVSKATKSRMCSFWETEVELASKVSVALMKEFMTNPRLGWIRATKISSPNVPEGNILIKKELQENIGTMENESIIMKLSNLLERYSIVENGSFVKKNTNLEENIQLFLDEKTRNGLAETTLYSYKLHLKLFKEYFPNKDISHINIDEIKNFLKYREENFDVKTKSTMETIRGILKIFFDWLVEEKIIDNNPVRRIKPYRLDDVIIESLSEEEIYELKDACSDLRERAVIELLLSTGCRLSELEKIKTDHINWAENTITVMGKRPRVVILSKEAKFHLQKYLSSREDDTKFLFITERRPYRNLSNRGIQRIITEVSKRTKIQKQISPRTFRHTFAKTMLDKGHQLNVIQSLLGNKLFSSTSETYVKITNENIKDILK